MIANIWLKRKILLDLLLLPLIIALVAIAAYGLGRLSALKQGKDKLIIHQPGEANAAAVQ